MKDSFKYQTAVDVAELARYLAALLEGFENGTLDLRENGRAFSVHPRGLIDLGIKARHKNGRVKFSLEIAWAEDEVEMPLLLTADAKQGKD